MRSSNCIVFTSLTLFSTTLSFSQALTIAGVPATVTQNQVNTFTWFRTSDDPTNFQFAKSSTGTLALGVIYPTLSVKKEETQGTITFTCADVRHEFIVAFDLSKVDEDVLPKAGIKKPPPFFTDNHTINILQAGDTRGASTNPPANHPPPTKATPQNTASGNTATATSPRTPTQTTPATQVTKPPTLVVAAATTTNETAGASDGSSRFSMNPIPPTRSVNSPVAGVVAGAGSSGASTPSPPGTGFSSSIGTPNGSLSPSVHPKSHSLNIGAIVGAILGFLAFIILVLLVICIRRRNQRKRSLPGRLETFYREKMIRSEDATPEPAQSDMEPLKTSSAGSVTRDTGNINNTIITSRNSSTTLDMPDHRTIYTITEMDSAFESYEGSDFTVTEPLGSELESYYGCAPRTDRQMDIEKKIFQLQELLITLRDETRSTGSRLSLFSTVGDIRERIGKLKVLQEGEWAKGISDEVPLEMF